MPPAEPTLLPPRFVERLEALFPPDLSARLLNTFREPKRCAFRINPLKSDASEVLPALHRLGIVPEPVSWYAEAFTVDASQKSLLTRNPLFEEGRIYIQNLSSMLAPLILAPRPKEQVLDLAAAPGGKTLLIAALMRNEGWISAVEPNKERFFRLKANLERGGVTIAHTYRSDGRGIGNKCPAMFDRVLLDAPCSTEVKFKEAVPQTYAYWSEKKIIETAKLQKRLLLSAVKSLKPNGTLLYATCSFAPEENEMVIDWLLRKEPSMQLEPVDLPVENLQPAVTAWKKWKASADMAPCIRILPDERMDGFFLAKLHKQRD